MKENEVIVSDSVGNWSQDAQVNIAIAIAALLVTTSAVTLPLLQSVTSSDAHWYLNDLFWAVGVGSIITSALLIDWVLDRAQIDFSHRLTLMGGGYLAFALLISLICLAVSAQFMKVQELDSLSTLVCFIMGSGSIFGKVMTQDDHDTAIYSFLVFYGLGYVQILFPSIAL
ncbi:MFS transporter [Vibrio crassostreae]|uniref:hypothetical protein n=1 Tax=Vibrio crassostreae TaxID=246167 RepID=UPI000C818D32|nr:MULTISPECIES: hypothetical protein [Vibrio]PMI01388.1 hypothetical protein BCU54_00325 [Vibrio lentus]CAK2847011.1 MFS transporter [Vibrio crassostreae]